MRRHLRIAAVVATFLAGLALNARPAIAAPPVPVPVDATVFVEIEPVGSRVTSVVLEYSRKIDLATKGSGVAAAFSVVATLEGNGPTTTAPRTITDAWVTSENNPKAPERRGRFLVLKLDVTDPNAGYAYAAGKQHYDLDGAYAITQLTDLINRHPTARVSAGTTINNSETRVLVVEDFNPGTFTASNGVSLDYQLYEPTVRAKTRYPLVLALHGIGGTGTENQAPLLNNQLGTAFSNPQRQNEDPSFVLVPQRKPSQGFWSAPDMTVALLELVQETKARMAVDAQRVYVTGNSMGGIGTWALVRAAPSIFAAAIPVCGWVDGDAQAARIADEGVPTWAFHSIDDDPYTGPWDYPGYPGVAQHDVFVDLEATGTAVTWGEWAGNLAVNAAAARAKELWADALGQGSEHLFTTYLAGTVPVDPHYAWIPTYSNASVLDWMFAQKRGDE